MEQSVGANPRSGSDRRPWLVGAVIAAVLVAIATAAVMLTGAREEASFEADSPEAVVQAYVAAWEAGDADTAYELLTPRAQERVERSDFRHAATWAETPTRVWVEEHQDLDDRVVLKLSVEWTWDGLLGPDRDIRPLRLTLQQIDDAWRIDTPMMGFNAW